MKLKGRVWVLRDAEGNPINDIDTDMIYHNAHLAITDIDQMGQYALCNLGGWEDFPSKAEEGDIIIIGSNFGAGSSRQQAVDCLISLGIQAIVAESFGAIYKRNAINAALPILICPDVMKANIENGHIVEIDLVTGTFKNLTSGEDITGMKPFSRVQMDIYKVGSLFGVVP